MCQTFSNTLWIKKAVYELLADWFAFVHDWVFNDEIPLDVS